MKKHENLFLKIMDLPLSDKFTYPITMVENSTFSDFLKNQKNEELPEDDLIERLSGLVKSSLNMSMFGMNRGPLPYISFPTPPSWEPVWESESGIYELERIKRALQDLYFKGNTIYPFENEIFTAFHKCKRNNVKVVILGQDPYPQLDSILGIPIACGMAFSGRRGGVTPGSLNRVFDEIRRTYNGIPLNHYDLTSWAEQGVLLLNTCLTVNKGDAGSHIKLNIWNYFMEYLIKDICDNCPGVIFCLWGAKAKAYATGQNPPIGKKIFKLTCGHPSSNNTSAEKFAENNHFRQIYDEINRQNQEIYNTNTKLYAEGKDLLPYKEQINWALV